MKYIVNKNCQIDISPFTAANIQISCKTGLKIGGADMYYGPMTLTLTSVADTSGGICPSMSISINGSAQKIKSNGMSVFLEGDFGSGVGTFTNSASGATYPMTVKATIIKAGQTKVKGV